MRWLLCDERALIESALHHHHHQHCGGGSGRDFRDNCLMADENLHILQPQIPHFAQLAMNSAQASTMLNSIIIHPHVYSSLLMYACQLQCPESFHKPCLFACRPIQFISIANNGICTAFPSHRLRRFVQPIRQIYSKKPTTFAIHPSIVHVKNRYLVTTNRHPY